MSEEARKLSKGDEKRLRILQDRRQRHLNEGVPPEKVDEVIAREDYERLPVEKKIARLEGLLSATAQGLGKDIETLFRNQGVLLDTMDVNFTAFEMMVTDLGVSIEKQRSYVEAAREVVEQKKRDRQRQTNAAADKSLKDAAATPGEPPPPPDGATVFGG